MARKVVGWFLFVLAAGNITWWILSPMDFNMATAIFTALFLFGWYWLALRKQVVDSE